MFKIYNVKTKETQTEIIIKSYGFLQLVRYMDIMSTALKLDKCISSPDKLINGLVEDLGYDSVDEFLELNNN